MRILLFLIFLTNISMANDYGNFLPDPFSKKKKINFSYNDISNYPIGIFDLLLKGSNPKSWLIFCPKIWLINTMNNKIFFI